MDEALAGKPPVILTALQAFVELTGKPPANFGKSR
jgi:hypothetical protein